MRCNILQLPKNLRFHSHGKEITYADILEWANTKVSNTGSQVRMDSFKVPTQLLLYQILSSLLGQYQLVLRLILLYIGLLIYSNQNP